MEPNQKTMQLNQQPNNLHLSKNVEVFKNGLKFTSDISFNEWTKIGHSLRLMEGSVQFWIGDWLNYGENTYDQWTQEFDETNQVDYGYLRNMKWIAKRVPLSRRRDNLSWSHHQEVADLEAEDQDLLLNEAETHKLNRTQFRKMVYTYKKKLDIPEMTSDQIDKIQTAHPDFEVVQPAVMTGADLLDSLDRLNLDDLVPNARDYLLSVLRDVVKKVGQILIKYENKQPKLQE
jgi:hypothetical protein